MTTEMDSYEDTATPSNDKIMVDVISHVAEFGSKSQLSDIRAKKREGLALAIKTFRANGVIKTEPGLR